MSDKILGFARILGVFGQCRASEVFPVPGIFGLPLNPTYGLMGRRRDFYWGFRRHLTDLS
ncbi:MAG: hypothetical protein OXT74_17730 [Candidatus Poribacteria bacterium]|nr:hypothetical protein [Candidatus Poribacteria bacterium]